MTQQSSYVPLALVILLGFLLCHNTESASSTNVFDLYRLEEQWQPKACADFGSKANDLCDQPQQKLTIHGLWPEYYAPKNGKGWPQFCHGADAFNPHDLPSSNELDTYWPTLTKGSETSFLKHEWERHGTCSGMTQIDYLEGAITAAKSVEEALSQVFEDALNDHSGTISKSAIVNAYGEGNIVVECDQGVLKTISTCFDKNLQPTQCPDGFFAHDSCDNTVQLSLDVNTQLLNAAVASAPPSVGLPCSVPLLGTNLLVVMMVSIAFGCFLFGRWSGKRAAMTEGVYAPILQNSKDDIY